MREEGGAEPAVAVPQREDMAQEACMALKARLQAPGTPLAPPLLEVLVLENTRFEVQEVISSQIVDLRIAD